MLIWIALDKVVIHTPVTFSKFACTCLEKRDSKNYIGDQLMYDLATIESKTNRPLSK